MNRGGGSQIQGNGDIWYCNSSFWAAVKVEASSSRHKQFAPSLQGSFRCSRLQRSSSCVVIAVF